MQHEAKRLPTPRRDPGDLMRYNGSATTARRISVPTLATIAGVVAIVYFAQSVFLPLAIAMLLTFALSPLATWLRKLGVPNLPAVLIVVTVAFALVCLFVLVVATQLTTLASNLPTFQANIISKVEALRNASSDTSLLRRLSNMIAAINAEVGARDTSALARDVVLPLKVEVIEQQGIIGMVQSLVLPLVSPIATTGLVIVVVVFMLLERTELRDRFIKLVGSDDLHRTTQVLQEAGRRVGRYLLIQLTVNIIYAVPIGVGLWLIGVPNALLWGLLTLVLRFVPYIGSILSAAFPLFLAFAVSPGWEAILWTLALFGVVELVTSNVIEPWLYGSRTGVSPLAIIVSAIFWTWLWGPMGLILSTPLTVCLVVLGRHIPQFELFDILFGDEPVLAPHARLYQRLLAGDVLEATSRADEALEDMYIGEYYRDVGIPALLIAHHDKRRGVLTHEQEDRLIFVAEAMVADLAEIAETDAAEKEEEEEEKHGEGFSVLCMGGRTDLDDVSALMLAQTMKAEGATAAHNPHNDLPLARFRNIGADQYDCLVLSYVDPSPSRASLLHIRRIKQAAPHLRVGVAIWEMPKDAQNRADARTGDAFTIAEAKLQEARDIGADFAVKSFEDLMRETFKKDTPRTIAPVHSHIRRGAFRTAR
ncbi:AI-2E family transporter [Falsirhodobacter sp. 20TX0035]|uniref:AI-2E family transporter n=1 Tax=Falsirhodobacter sp. 20TX0035 TaxID=3022019 RepID=UPI00232F60D4|nr:AI-2E family transporter [Falsirhodobacter sp. 20TX0035]MDB6452870.1 AI-2E family transporter [Falsirhodobacter sp. 20TX0035]